MASAAPLAVVGCGMMTAVGLDAPSSCAAIRAGIAGYAETRFVGPAGERLVGAEVPLPEPWRGAARLARMLAGVLGECLAARPDIDPAAVPVLLCVAEADRPGRLDGLGSPLFYAACDRLDVRFHAASRIVDAGRVGGVAALLQARRLVGDGHRRVIVAGIDSHLVAETIDAHLAAERLLGPDTLDGFLPGEAAAAVLLEADAAGLGLHGLGFARETATRDSGEPLRAEAMTEAMRTALADSGLTMARIGYRMGDLAGEQYAFKEADLAVARLLRERHGVQELWHPADRIGEVGAAIGPAMLAVAHTAARKGYAPGDPLLIHAGNDDGRRAALVASAGPG